MHLETFRFWIAVLMLVDAAFGLWGESTWQAMLPNIRIRRIALIEALVALVILFIHFIVDRP